MDVRCLDDASYVLGALTPAEQRVFQRHLARCSRCQASVRQLTQVQWLLAGRFAPVVAPSLGFHVVTSPEQLKLEPAGRVVGHALPGQPRPRPGGGVFCVARLWQADTRSLGRT
jgi:anti-sigma factor RsiW